MKDRGFGGLSAEAKAEATWNWSPREGLWHETRRVIFPEQPQSLNKGWRRNFSGSPVARTPHCQFRGPGSIPGKGTRSHMPQLRPSTMKQIFLKKEGEGKKRRAM